MKIRTFRVGDWLFSFKGVRLQSIQELRKDVVFGFEYYHPLWNRY
jgi:hypothetical protein